MLLTRMLHRWKLGRVKIREVYQLLQACLSEHQLLAADAAGSSRLIAAYVSHISLLTHHLREIDSVQRILSVCKGQRLTSPHLLLQPDKPRALDLD